VTGAEPDIAAGDVLAGRSFEVFSSANVGWKLVVATFRDQGNLVAVFRQPDGTYLALTGSDLRTAVEYAEPHLKEGAR
jgi:hypothetical protein